MFDEMDANLQGSGSQSSGSEIRSKQDVGPQGVNTRPSKNDGMLDVSFPGKTSSIDKDDEALVSDIKTSDYYHHFGLRDKLFLVDEVNQQIYVFKGKHIPGVLRVTEKITSDRGIKNFFEIRSDIKECSVKVKGNDPLWPQQDLNSAYEDFKNKFKELNLRISLDAFKEMLRINFSQDYKRLLERSTIVKNIRPSEELPHHTSLVEYTNILTPDAAKVKLYFIKDGQFILFEGKSIADVAKIRSSRLQYGRMGHPKSVVYEILVLEGVKTFNVFSEPNDRFWPQVNFKKAYDDFKEQQKADVSFDVFKNFLKENYPLSYARISGNEEQIENFAKGSEVQMVEITTSKRSYQEPHPDVLVIAPDGQEWIISHKASSQTEIEGVCRIVDTISYNDYKGEVNTFYLVVAKDVKVQKKHYKNNKDLSSVYFINGDVYKVGTPLEIKAPPVEKKVIELPDGDGPLSQEDALAALKRIFG